MAGYRTHHGDSQPHDSLGQKGKRVRIRCLRPSSFDYGTTGRSVGTFTDAARPVYRVQGTCRSCLGWTYTYLPSGQKKPCKPCNQTGLNQRKGA